MPLQEGDHVRLQCEDCYRPLGRFGLGRHHGVGPLLLAECGTYNRLGGDPGPEWHRTPQTRGPRRGRVWKSEYDGNQDGHLRYRYECRCGRTILLSTKRIERLVAACRDRRDAVLLV